MYKVIEFVQLGSWYLETLPLTTTEALKFQDDVKGTKLCFVMFHWGGDFLSQMLKNVPAGLGMAILGTGTCSRERQ